MKTDEISTKLLFVKISEKFTTQKEQDFQKQNQKFTGTCSS
jgi:hypothetical protein